MKTPPLTEKEQIYFMSLALDIAKEASNRKEVPVGAVIVKENKVVATSGNFRENSQNPLSHAEIHVIQEAAQKFGSWRLEGCQLFVTLEPCIMCAGAMLQSRIEHLFYGASSPKSGVLTLGYNFLSDQRLNHQIEVNGGILKAESAELLSGFFSSLRKEK